MASSTLKGNQRRYEYEVLCRLREVLAAGVKVTVVADRGFAARGGTPRCTESGEAPA